MSENEERVLRTSETKPTQAVPPSWRLTIYSLATGGLCCYLLVGIGRGSAVLREIYHGFHMPLDWRLKFLDATNLCWTLPVGILLAVFIILKDRSGLRPRAVLIDLVVLLVTLSFCLLWAWAAFWPVIVDRLSSRQSLRLSLGESSRLSSRQRLGTLRVIFVIYGSKHPVRVYARWGYTQGHWGASLDRKKSRSRRFDGD